MGGGAIDADAREPSPKFRDALRTRAFGVLYAAETQSTVGDQLARVALSVLVFDRTNSAAATALTYAATFLPAIAGGAVLARIGDILPRRLVMVGCDVVRAALFGAMAIPGVPLPAMILLLVLAVFVGPAFSASEVSYLATAMDPELFRLGNGLRLMTGQVAQVAGFAVGGALVAALHPRGALLIDAATYVVSALVITLALQSLPSSSAAPPDSSKSTQRNERRRALAVLWRMPRLRTAIGLCWLAGFFVVPEGLAVPFGRQVGASIAQTGLLFASIPLGGAVGAFLLMRAVGPSHREAPAVWMAFLCGLPLVICLLKPSWPVALVLWTISGACAAYQVEVTTAIATHVPSQIRSQVLGYVSAGLIGAQGIGLCVFGFVAQGPGAASAVAAAGAAGSVIAVLVYLGGRARRDRREVPEEGPRHRWGAGASSAPGGGSGDIARR
jgi:MFS family permease